MKIVIAGAGYAGTVAANRLAKKAKDADITVVNPYADFVERVRMHEMITGSGTATRRLSDVLHERVTLRVAVVEKIGDDVVSLSDGTDLDYDRLIYAVGSSRTAPAGTLSVGGLDSARAAAEQFAALPPRSTVTVVGGGLTGIETASEVATERKDLKVKLVSEDEVGFSLSDTARDRVVRVLTELGVETVRGRWSPDGADLTLWAVAGAVNTLAARCGLRTNADGLVVVDEFLRSTSHPTVYAVGDGAAVPGTRMSCQAALPQGTHAANNVIREMRDADPKAFSMAFVGQNVSLGRRNGVIQAAKRDDTPIGAWFGGRPAAEFKELVCKGAAWTAEHGTYAWLPGPR
ncbi:NAD(P)/FAD-dependent oxidoreductase [Gordonia zhaorongruii]|uniref:NAD(P)/FAD-dependent oxidoreductase n=1 Tax=Gordonia zhaorongruii TaxID=2597659 RepID=UPI0010514CF8|nr:FAD-dependent oxidoreductase [Gordonia zhaorongruii]